MIPYRRFASFYDAVMDDPGRRADRVTQWIERFCPGASSLLELGCGTGSILARLSQMADLTGLDRSAQMLAVAKEKVPEARLLEGDMRAFSLNRRYDVVICVFDSLNHLLDFEEWRSTFEAVHAHLVDGGLFLFDVNTVGELRRLGEEPPWVYDFDQGVAIVDVVVAAGLLAQGPFAEVPPSVISSWDIRIFERLGGSRYELHQEQIGELAVPLAWVRSALQGRFDLLEEVGEDGEPPTDRSIKGHFACRRR